MTERLPNGDLPGAYVIDTTNRNVTIEIKVPEAELRLLRETLHLSKERQKDPVRFIQSKSLPDCISHAASTVDVSHWKHLWKFADKLGVERPI